ncbi:hypothetical protein B0H14DRAFT_2593317 [Mycena olivaceomarginata]|nr:hypothetical protein B0H14DRAFT_2593317 [Mycena olivaceomarginata]
MAATTTDLIQTLQSTSGQGPRFRPFASSVHHVTKGSHFLRRLPPLNARVSPVYEYPLNSQWIMMDIDDGYILWTGIWKALGNPSPSSPKSYDECGVAISKYKGRGCPFESRMEYPGRFNSPFRADVSQHMLVPRPTWLRPSGSVYWSPESAPERTAASIAHDPAPDNRLLNGQPVSLHQPSVFVSAPPLSNYAAQSTRLPYTLWMSKPTPIPRSVLASPVISTAMPVPCTLISHAALAKALDLFREFCVPRISTSVSARWTRVTRRRLFALRRRIQLPAIQQPATRDPQPEPGGWTNSSGHADARFRRPPQKHSAPPTAPHRSLGHIPPPRMEYPKLRVSVPPDISRDGDSTCDPSPISPATPRSAVLGKDQLSLVPLSVLNSRAARPLRTPSPSSSTTTG